ncbi:MAG TPA: sulfite exporter TauE/SafE family protein [Burkholderiaceae bacterium]|nr:sulfite exporter TauE/SafE family protein [Burkholderiaceae bacterium]
MNDIIFISAGFGVGLVIGLTGVGGGSLMTPLLIFVFGVKPHLAIGTDLLFAAFTKLGGSIKLARAKLIDWPVVGLLAAGSLPASLLTLYMLNQIGTTNPVVQRVMTTTLGIALLLTALATLYKAIWSKAPVKRATDTHKPTSKPSQAKHWSLPLLLGAVIGALVTLTSVGAGAIGMTALILLYPALPLPRIVAADIAHAVPLTLVAGLGHASLGSVDWSLLALLLAGSLPGIYLGSHLLAKTPERVVRSVLSVLLAYAGSKLLAI